MKNSFEDWKEAGVQYAADHPELEMWEFQVRNMASDFAWRMEGMEITPQSVEYAYKDWISGNNPYSVHTIGFRSEEFGYDYKEWVFRRNVAAEDKYRQHALDNGIEAENLDRYISGIHVELYFDKNTAHYAIKDWFSGKTPESPHHIPLDPAHLQDREERKKYVRTLFPKMGRDFMWQLSRDGERLAPGLDIYKYYDRRYVQGIPPEQLVRT